MPPKLSRSLLSYALVIISISNIPFHRPGYTVKTQSFSKPIAEHIKLLSFPFISERKVTYRQKTTPLMPLTPTTLYKCLLCDFHASDLLPNTVNTPPLTCSLSYVAHPLFLTSPQRFQVFGKYAILQNRVGPRFIYGSFQLASILTWPENSIALTNFGKLVFNKFNPILLIWHSLCSWATTSYIKNLPFSCLGKMPYKKNQYTISFWRK